MNAMKQYDLKELQEHYLEFITSKGIESPCLLTFSHKVGNVIYLRKKCY